MKPVYLVIICDKDGQEKPARNPSTNKTFGLDWYEALYWANRINELDDAGPVEGGFQTNLNAYVAPTGTRRHVADGPGYW